MGKTGSMYHAFGLAIASEIPLPELAEDEGVHRDVRIGLHHEAAPRERDSAYWFEPDIDPFAFRVADGEEIDIWAPLDAVREDISIWLLGTVMAALLHQRGRLTVHANCIETPDGRTVALAGDSGSGKSSLAALAVSSGWSVLGDDLLTIERGGTVYPGVLRLKLWREDLALLDLDAARLSRVASDLDKYHVPLPPVEKGPRRLDRLYMLGEGDLGFERLEGVAAANALLANLYRFEVGQQVRAQSGSQFEAALALADQVEVWRFDRPRQRSDLARHFDALADHAAQ